MHKTQYLASLTVAVLIGSLVSLAAPNEPAAVAVHEENWVALSSTTTTLGNPEVLDVSLKRAVEIEVAAVADELHETTTTTTTTTTTAPPAPPTTSAPAGGSGPAPSNGQPTATTAPPATTAPAPAGGPSSGAESQFASSINSYRSSNGLPALSRNGSLDSRARAWAENMAENGSLSHSNLGSLLPPWSAAAENVGMGGSVSAIFGALQGSSGHRANMLGDYTHFGIGVWVDSSGTMWTAHVFTR